MTEPPTTWAFVRVSYNSRPGEGKLLRVDTDKKDLAGRARPLNAQQRKSVFYARNGYPRYTFKVIAVPLS